MKQDITQSANSHRPPASSHGALRILQINSNVTVFSEEPWKIHDIWLTLLSLSPRHNHQPVEGRVIPCPQLAPKILQANNSISALSNVII